ncbi:MAG: phosphate acyltransferase PlsX [Sedimentisphaerales bacterium]|nr:phosphate acyltransferase PlsX [Sedimentisphaerales bacterium]
MRIAIDAMGGDLAPDAVISGSLLALESLEKGDEVILVGPKEVLEPKVQGRGGYSATLSIEHAPDVIGMDEPPVESLRKMPRSSISILAKLGKLGKADAVISAGNTGACVAAFQMRMRNLEGVNRPGIAVVFPTFTGPVTICDVGANIACKPINLYQYAVMSMIYARRLFGIQSPRIGLMSIGEEDAKGNENVKKAREFLKKDPKINFIGNIEGRDIFKGVCDVAVCDGFVGNVILKLTEGLVDGLFKAIKQEVMSQKMNFLLAPIFKSIMTNIYKKHDYNEYGGALLLGVNGTALICHGASEARTIKNAILISKKYYGERINEKIAAYLAASAIVEDTPAGEPQDVALRVTDGQVD